MYQYESDSSIAEKVLETAILRPDLSEYEFILLIAATKGPNISESWAKELASICRDRFNMYKPVEMIKWARNQLYSYNDFSHPSMPEKPTVVKMFDLDAIQHVKAGYALGGRLEELAEQLEAKNDIELSLDMWTTFPEEVQNVVVKQLPIPAGVLRRMKFDEDAVHQLVSEDTYQTFQIPESLLLENESVVHYIIEYFTNISTHQFFIYMSSIEDPLVKKPSFSALVNRRTRVFQRWNGAAAIFYNYFGPPRDAMRHWQSYKEDLDAHLDEQVVADLMIHRITPSYEAEWNVMESGRMPEKLVRCCYNKMTDPTLGVKLQVEISNYAILVLKNRLPALVSKNSNNFDPERVLGLVMCGVPAGQSLESVAQALQQVVSPIYANLLWLIAPSFLKRVVESGLHQLEVFESNWAKFIVLCCLSGKDVVQALCNQAPEELAAVTSGPPTNIWHYLVNTGKFELLEPMVLNKTVYRSLTGWVPMSAQIATLLVQTASVRVALLIVRAQIMEQTANSYLDQVDTLFKRFKKEITAILVDPEYPDKIFLWLFMSGVDLNNDFVKEDILLQWYAGWDQSRVKWLLKEGAPLISVCIDSLSDRRHIVDEVLLRVRCISVAQLNILAAKENWDGFLTTAVSYHKLFSGINEYDMPIMATNVASMIGFFRLGNVEKARKIALQLDSEVGPGREFHYLDAVNIWNKITASANSSATQSSSVKPVAKAAGAKKKKNKKKAVAAQPETSSASTDIDLSVQYEPDTKPYKASSHQSSSASSSVASPLPSMDGSKDVPYAQPASSSAFEQPESGHSASSSAAVLSVSSSLPTTGINPIGYNQASQSRVVYAACPICLESFPDCVVIPCGHTFCVHCIKKLTFCSICREPVSQWMRMYISQGEADD
jgi:hypothetical protein